ncbi:MAG TPA: helix-turn-helix domain-containing protein [Gemmataceae bacterium]|jgi:excisionase family DNA binding protein
MSKTENSNAMEIPEVLRKPTCTVEEAGEVLGVSRGVAYKAARSGELPVMKFGRTVRVITAALRRQLGLEAA